MRFKLLKSFVSLTINSKNINKIKLFLNIAIFLSIFAITSSFISIYFESKITEIENDINRNDTFNDILSISSNSLTTSIESVEEIIDNSDRENDLYHFIYFSKMGSIITSRDMYYMPAMSLKAILKTKFKVLDDFKELRFFKGVGDEFFKYHDDKKLTEYFDTSDSYQKQFDEITKKIEKQHADVNTFENGIKVVTDNEFYTNYETYLGDYKEIANNVVQSLVGIFKWTRAVHNNIENKNQNNRKEITYYSNLSQNFIIAAFCFQLIIFLIVQIMEIIATRRDINDKK